jgi:PPOX class probable F420-dependent enzyme
MLDPVIKTLATEKNFAMLSFQLPNGQIGSHVMWIDADDEHLLINTEVHRAKYQAMTASPQVTVTIWNFDNAYQYAEVRGHVADEIRGDEARAHIDACSRRYTGVDYQGEIKSERVVVKIAPDRQRTWGM